MTGAVAGSAPIFPALQMLAGRAGASRRPGVTELGEESHCDIAQDHGGCGLFLKTHKYRYGKSAYRPEHENQSLRFVACHLMTFC